MRKNSRTRMPKCPLCNNPLIVSQLDSRFGQCTQDATLWNLDAASLDYDADYFGREYKQQYGKNYIDDKQSLLNRMRVRWQYLKPMAPSAPAKVLEVGSAAGFFLSFFKNLGYEETGWEISAQMSKLSRKSGNNTLTGDFFNLYHQWEKEKADAFDMVLGFYVFEHLSDQKLLWEALEKLVRKNGILVMALPSIFGPTYLFQRKKFYQTHPKDHFVDYSPYSIFHTSKKYHFTLLKTFPEGIHPDRFPSGNILGLKHIYEKLQYSLSCSDTLLAVLKKN